MGNFCKTCDQKITEKKNEILGEVKDYSDNINNRKFKINKIKEKIKLRADNNLKDYIPEIIFLQRNIKRYLSKKRESAQDLFYHKF